MSAVLWTVNWLASSQDYQPGPGDRRRRYIPKLYANVKVLHVGKRPRTSTQMAVLQQGHRGRFPTTTRARRAFPMNGPASEHQERLERFVCRENVARFRRLLTTESDEAERDLLLKLLIEEQEKPLYLAV
nr:hypothetical protein [uncultured Rhodopila sp.]